MFLEFGAFWTLEFSRLSFFWTRFPQSGKQSLNYVGQSYDSGGTNLGKVGKTSASLKGCDDLLALAVSRTLLPK